MRPLNLLTTTNILSIAVLMCTLSCTTLGRQTDRTALKKQLIDSQVEIAKVQIDDGEPEKALESLRKLLRKFPENNKLLTMYGMAHLALSNPKTGTRFLYQAYKNDPSTAAGLNLSSGYISSKQYSRARVLLFKLVKKKDSYQYKERVWHNLGIIYLKEKKTADAAKAFTKALTINPNYYMSLLEMGKIEKKRNNQKKSISYLKKSSKACSNCYENIHLLATEYLLVGQPNKARKILRAYLKNEQAPESSKDEALKLIKVVSKYSTKDRSSHKIGRTVRGSKHPTRAKQQYKTR